jgi:hypothetical protein
VRGVIGHPGHDALLHKRFQPIRQDIGGDSLFRARQELTEMPAVTEHRVADDEQTPFVAHHLQREIDRASRPVLFGHSLLRKKLVAVRYRFS